MIGSWQSVVASDWPIVQVIMSCRGIERSSGSNHVLYLISILNCHRAAMNVCLNEVLKRDCGSRTNIYRYLLMVNNNKPDSAGRDGR